MLTLIALVSAAGAFDAAQPQPSGVVTVVGNSIARVCYETAAGTRSANDENLRACGLALSNSALNRHDLVATWVNRGIVRMRRGDERGGVEDFDAALALDPNQPEALLNKAIALVRRGDGRSAVDLFSRAISLRTARPELAHYGRAIAYEQGGRVADAYRDYQRAAALKPDWADPREELRRFRVQPRTPART